MNTNKPTLILGASANPIRYSNEAIRRLKNAGHTVYLLAKRENEANGEKIYASPQPLKNIHTVTLYIGASHQPEYYNYLLGLKPKRIIFNPGAENHELAELCLKNGIEPEEACTLVLLSIGEY